MAEDGLGIRIAEEKNRKIIFAFMRSERLVWNTGRKIPVKTYL
jgi:hypothetical protein